MYLDTFPFVFKYSKFPTKKAHLIAFILRYFIQNWGSLVAWVESAIGEEEEKEEKQYTYS